MRIVGIDEVGRGCWAGPVVAGAVVLPDGYVYDGAVGWKLGDSKKLTKGQRIAADYEIRQIALSVGLGWVSAVEVDQIGLTAAVSLAMKRALRQIVGTYDEIIVDGSFNFLDDVSHVKTVVKADASIPAVSAASILAKVARDDWMYEAAQRFPEYGFESHVGYGTKRHTEALRQYGVCELHRRSYRPVRQFC
jgi:ribonuclease HII